MSSSSSEELVKSTSPAMVIVGKSGKKICCACPMTKKERDECVVLNGPEACTEKIEAHKRCLRDDGFQLE